MPHIELGELHEKLKSFAKKRKKTLTAALRYALETYLFVLEEEDPKRDAAIKRVIDKRFTIPKNIPYRSFYVFLYMLAKKYPHQSSNSFWTETIFIGHTHMSHLEVFNTIQNDLRDLLHDSNQS